MAESIPQFDSLAQGLDYANVTTPTTDAAPSNNVSFTVKDSMNDTPTLTQANSGATTTAAAPTRGAFLSTNIHDTNWLDPMKPHVSPESQG